MKEASPGLSAVSKYLPTPPNMARFAKWAYRKIKGFPEEEEKTESSKEQVPKEMQGTTQNPETTRKRVEEATRQKEKTDNTSSIPDISDEIYKATHNDLQNQLHDIDQRAEKLRKEGVEEAQIVAFSEAQKAKVYKDFNNNVISQIDASWKSELQNRLDNIEREKQAWIEKGVSEVKATEWAENEKGKARQNAALSALREQREYLDIVKNAMNGSGTMEERMNRARVGVLTAMREKLGISNDSLTPGLLSAFSTVMNDVQNNLVRGLETQDWARKLDQSSISVIRGSREYHDVPGVNNTVIINGGVFENNETLKKFSDATADKFIEAYRSSTQNSLLSY